jgi:hypothetical protein
MGWSCGDAANPLTQKFSKRFNQKLLRKLANASWYISSITLHNDLNMPHVIELIRVYAKKHKNRTAQNNNQLIMDLFSHPEIERGLNRMWPEDLSR